MVFDEWWNQNNASIRGLGEQVLMSRLELEQLFRQGWNAAQRELLLELTKAKMDGADTVIAAEIQRVKNFKSLL